MFKLLILNSDIESIKILCNCIINEISEIQLSGFTTNMEEFESLFSKVKPNIIMMDHSDYIHSKYYKNPEFKKLKVITFNSSQASRSNSKQLFLSRNATQNEIIKSINDFVSKNSIDRLRKKIIKILETYHVDFKLIGTIYLIESILYCYENKSDYVFENLERNVYPHVAKIYNVSTHNVKWSIVRTVNIMNANMSISAQKQVSGNKIVNISEKTTAKQLINTIITKLDF